MESRSRTGTYVIALLRSVVALARAFRASILKTIVTISEHHSGHQVFSARGKESAMSCLRLLSRFTEFKQLIC